MAPNEAEPNRPVSILDLLLFVALIAVVLGVYIPLWKTAQDPQMWLRDVSPAFWGPIGVSALIGFLIVPTLHVITGACVLASRTSWLAKLMGLVLLFIAIPVAVACVRIAVLVGLMMAG